MDTVHSGHTFFDGGLFHYDRLGTHSQKQKWWFVNLGQVKGKNVTVSHLNELNIPERIKKET